MVDKLRFVGMLMNLTDLCEVFTDGDWIESKDQSKDGIRLIQTGNIGIGQFIEKDDKAKYISIETFERLKCTEVFEGDILVSRLPDPIGRACIVPNKTERMITAVDCTICRPKADIIDREYLCYFMQSKTYYERLFNNVTGTTRKRISRKNLGNVEIYVPSKEEQKIIVKKLNLLTKIISNRTKELSYLDNLIKARFVEMFGDVNANDRKWPIKPLGELCNIVRGASPRPIEKFLGGTVPWIKIGDATENESVYLNSTKEHIIENGVKKSRLVKSGSLIFANCGVSLGFARIITFDGCIHDGWLAMEDVDQKLDKVFLLHTLNQVTEHFRKVAPAGTQPNLNTAIMKSYKQILPPLELQRTFIEFAKQVDKSKVAIQKSLAETQLLFDKLMQDYFG